MTTGTEGSEYESGRDHSEGRGVVLFNRGTNCLIRMIVCLHSLRKWWSGPVTVYLEGGHPEQFLKVLRELSVTIVTVPASPAGNFVRKIETASQSPYDRTLWLDSDTLVCRPIDELFDALDHHELVAPHFAGWSSHGKTIRSRVMQYQGLCPDEWLSKAVEPHPAVNGGVFAFRKGASILGPWIELSRKGDGVVRLSDEVALQILLPRFLVGILPCKFNVSVKFPKEVEDARIVHFHGRKHVRDFPLCDRWKAEFAEVRDNPRLALEDLLPWADRELRRYLSSQPDVTIVTACDPVYVHKLKLTFPTWEKHKRLTQYPVIVFVEGMPLDDPRLDFLRVRNVRLVTWDFPVENQREKMLSAFVFGVARHVRTPWWMKLDADCFATDNSPLFTPEMKRFTFYGHRWGYSFPDHIKALDAWAAAHPELNTKPLFDPACVDGRKYRHPRTQSFAQLEKTSFTRFAANLAGARLPIASQDTYIGYLALALGEPIGRANFKAVHGLGHSGRMMRLRQEARRSQQAVGPEEAWKSRPGFFFVQIGANDGVTDDPIHADVKRYGWKGLLVEPLLHVFERLRSNYQDQTGLIFENAAIATEPGARPLYRLQPGASSEGPRRAGPTSDCCATFDRSLAVRQFGERNLIEEQVPCVPLRTLIKRHGIRRIDLLQIDTEGFDFEVLKQVDFRKWRVQRVRYEHMHLSRDDRQAAEALLVNHGFKVTERSRRDTMAQRE